MKNDSISNYSITVLIETRNEKDRIEKCIQSAHYLTKNVIVVDMESTDNTIKLAKQLGAHVFSFPYSLYVEPAREFGIQKVKTEWVFILDADEHMTPELAEEVNHVIWENKSTYFKVPRKNFFGPKTTLIHGGWWPDYQIRLLKIASFVSWPKRIHATPEIKGTMDYLKIPLLHYSHGDFTGMVEKTSLFEDIESDLLYKANKSVKTSTFFRKFLGELMRRLVLMQGFRDGKAGIIESIYQAYSKTVTYLYLYEKKESRTLRSLP